MLRLHPCPIRTNVRYSTYPGRPAVQIVQAVALQCLRKLRDRVRPLFWISTRPSERKNKHTWLRSKDPLLMSCGPGSWTSASRLKHCSNATGEVRSQWKEWSDAR